MTAAEEVLEGLRAGRLCTVCEAVEPDDWSIDLCHCCAHIAHVLEMTGRVTSLSTLSTKCDRCRAAYFRAKIR